MPRPIILIVLVSISIATAAVDIRGEEVELATFQVPDLSPPSPDDPDPSEDLPVPENPFADDEPQASNDLAIPAPMAYPGSALPLLNDMPVPYSHPGAHLWAGRYGHEETLVPCERPLAWASVDMQWLQRDTGGGGPLAIDPNQQVVLHTNQFNFDYEPGVRVIYGKVVNCIPLELTYFGAHDWNSSIFVDGDGDDLIVPFGPAGGEFEDADEVAANYGSELHSIELNALKTDGCHVTWMAGLRYIDTEEDFDLLIGDDPTDIDGLVAIDTDNRLLGLQVGVDAQTNCNGWSIGVVAKAGAYLNFAERDMLLFDDDLDLTLPLASDDTEVAFVGEAMLGVTRHLGCGIRLRGGYQLIWIDGVALATEQIGNIAAPGFAPPSLNTNGSVLYDGGYVGLEWHR